MPEDKKKAGAGAGFLFARGGRGYIEERLELDLRALERFAVDLRAEDFLALERFAVDLRAEDFRALERFAVDFLADDFFAPARRVDFLALLFFFAVAIVISPELE